MTPAQQQVLFGNAVRAVGDAAQAITLRRIGNLVQAGPADGASEAQALAQ